MLKKLITFAKHFKKSSHRTWGDLGIQATTKQKVSIMLNFTRSALTFVWDIIKTAEPEQILLGKKMFRPKRNEAG